MNWIKRLFSQTSSQSSPAPTSKMTAAVDAALCTGCGDCAETCPDVFELVDDTSQPKVQYISPIQLPLIEQAVTNCPMQAITTRSHVTEEQSSVHDSKGTQQSTSKETGRAAQSGKIEQAYLMMLGAWSGADSNQLCLAARNGDLDALKKDAQTFTNINDACDGRSRTPLQYASMSGCDSIVAYLINAGALPDGGQTDYTALHYATMAAALLQSGIKKEHKQWLPDNARFRNHLAVVRQLIAANANVNAKCWKLKFTPLHFAAYAGLSEMCQVLIKAGAECGEDVLSIADPRIRIALAPTTNKKDKGKTEGDPRVSSQTTQPPPTAEMAQPQPVAQRKQVQNDAPPAPTDMKLVSDALSKFLEETEDDARLEQVKVIKAMEGKSLGPLLHEAFDEYGDPTTQNINIYKIRVAVWCGCALHPDAFDLFYRTKYQNGRTRMLDEMRAINMKDGMNGRTYVHRLLAQFTPTTSPKATQISIETILWRTHALCFIEEIGVDEQRWPASWPKDAPCALGLLIETCVKLGECVYGEVKPYSHQAFKYDAFTKVAVDLKQSLSTEERKRATAFLRAVTRTWADGDLSRILHNGAVIPLLLLILGEKQLSDVSLVRQIAGNMNCPEGAAALYSKYLSE